MKNPDVHAPRKGTSSAVPCSLPRNLQGHREGKHGCMSVPAASEFPRLSKSCISIQHQDQPAVPCSIV